MEIRFSENDIRDLLNIVGVFDPTIGHYQFFTVNEQFSYIVKLSNGTIHFTIDDLIAHREQRISKEQLMQIASRFSRTATQSGPQRRRDSAIPDEYAAALGISEPRRNKSKTLILVAGIIMVLGMAGAMVVLIGDPETDSPSYSGEPEKAGDTIKQRQGKEF